MNKTAIRNFAVWARRKLIDDISYKAGLLGITEKGIAEPLPQSTRDMQMFDIGTKEPVKVTGNAIEQRRMLQSITDALRTAQQQYVTGLGELNSSLAKREDAICTKMDAILERLDKLDFEDIRKKCDGIRESINVKFAVAMVGIVGTLAFAALSFFMK